MLSLISLLAFPFALAAPLSSRQQLIPDLPAQADLAMAGAKVHTIAYFASGRHAQFNNYGIWLNSLVPISSTVDSVIGKDQVTAIDVLADRLCIAGQNQGSLCDELLSYAYSWVVIQEKGKTGRELAQILGPNNMAQLTSDLHTLCLGDESTPQFNKELCQFVLEDVDVLANSIIGESDLSEDNTNSNSLEYFGLADLLPKPQAII